MALDQPSKCLLRVADRLFLVNSRCVRFQGSGSLRCVAADRQHGSQSDLRSLPVRSTTRESAGQARRRPILKGSRRRAWLFLEQYLYRITGIIDRVWVLRGNIAETGNEEGRKCCWNLAEYGWFDYTFVSIMNTLRIGSFSERSRSASTWSSIDGAKPSALLGFLLKCSGQSYCAVNRGGPSTVPQKCCSRAASVLYRSRFEAVVGC